LKITLRISQTFTSILVYLSEYSSKNYNFCETLYFKVNELCKVYGQRSILIIVVVVAAAAAVLLTRHRGDVDVIVNDDIFYLALLSS